jgi:hypothetical protein
MDGAGLRSHIRKAAKPMMPQVSRKFLRHFLNKPVYFLRRNASASASRGFSDLVSAGGM